MRKIFKSSLLLCSIIFTAAQAQPRMTLNDAIKTGLQNNFSIRIAEGSRRIAGNNATIGNAGFLPEADMSASKEYSINNTHQEARDGSVTERTNAKSDNASAGISLNWTIFDGTEMFIEYNRLKELRQMGELRAKQAIEENLAGIIDAYYNIVSNQQNIDALKYTLAVSQERLKLTEDKYNLGSASKLELLQARVDLNADRAALLKQQISLVNAKSQLNQLIGRKPETEMIVQDTIIVSGELEYQPMKQNVLDNNYSLLQSSSNISLANLNLSSMKALWLPRLDFSMGYDYSNTNSDYASFKVNRLHGFSYGLTLRLNIFEGFNTGRRIENAGIELENSRIEYDLERSRVLTDFETSWANYASGLDLLKLETENLSVARQTMEVAYEKMKYGEYSPLEFREAQRSYITALSRLVAAQYSAKVAEVELLRLSGQIRN
ncbi:MAG: TolC family protein [Bacteroidota bacterium]